MLRVGQCDRTDCDTTEICQALNVNTTTASASTESEVGGMGTSLTTYSLMVNNPPSQT